MVPSTADRIAIASGSMAATMVSTLLFHCVFFHFYYIVLGSFFGNISPKHRNSDSRSEGKGAGYHSLYSESTPFQTGSILRNTWQKFLQTQQNVCLSSIPGNISLSI